MKSNLSRTAIAGAAIAAASLAAACSSAPPEATGSSQALVINPVGNENESHLTLQLPTDACLPGATCAKVLGQAPSVTVDGVPVSLGASTRLKPGTHTLATNGISAPVTTTAGQSTTIILPIADRKCIDVALPNVPKTDFGGSISVANAACPTTAQGEATGVTPTGPTEYYDSTCSSIWTSYSAGSVPNCSGANSSPYNSDTFSYRTGAGVCVNAGIGFNGCTAAALAIIGSVPGTAPLTDAYQAYVPGVLAATVNGASQSLTLKAGDEVDFNISLPPIGTVPASFATNITFLEARVNTDALRGTITSSCSGDRTYTIPSATGTPAPLALNAFVDSTCTYTLNVGGRTQALTQSATNAVSLHRLDVNAVTITREDGTTYQVSGTYSLNFGGVQVAGPFNTGTGIDVLAGTYQFSLNYTDFDGPQTQTQTLTF